MTTRTAYTVSSVDPRNTASYVRFISAATPEAAAAHERAKGLRVDAVEPTRPYLLTPDYIEAYSVTVGVAHDDSDPGVTDAAAACPECGAAPVGSACYHICPNSDHYYSPEREREDDALYGCDRYDGWGDPDLYDDFDLSADR